MQKVTAHEYSYEDRESFLEEVQQRLEDWKVELESAKEDEQSAVDAKYSREIEELEHKQQQVEKRLEDWRAHHSEHDQTEHADTSSGVEERAKSAWDDFVSEMKEMGDSIEQKWQELRS